MNLEPGTLCIIIKGKSCGKSTIAIRPVEPSVVAAILSKRFNIPDILFDDQGQLWEVDIPVEWEQHYTGMITEIPYAPANHLLPIPPLADPLDIAQTRELELQS